MKNNHAWMAIDIKDMPLKKSVINGYLKLKDMLIISEKICKGGETFETSCDWVQGHKDGFRDMIPIPTFRSIFIGQCPDGYITATFRYISKMGLKEIVEEGKKYKTKVKIEYVDTLPCFPKYLAISEIDGQYSGEVIKQLHIEKGLDPNVMKYDDPLKNEPSDPRHYIIG